ncbi:MAG: BatA domain-containing protein, partial [Planctomycetes bacterium]|nr:BatA domain-containing protein [Planctomycetota bacterium]
MSFLNPLNLFFLALALPLIAVFILKVRPHRKPTTQFFLWQQAFVEK